MRKSFVLVVAVLAMAIATPSSASAASIVLKVTPTYELTNACRPAAGQIRFQIRFGAKFKRKNSGYPKSVKFSYTVRDENGVQFASGAVTLKKKTGWKKNSANLTANTGTTIYFNIKGTFRSPSNGQLLTNTDSFSLPLATDDELVANGIPPCA